MKNHHSKQKGPFLALEPTGSLEATDNPKSTKHLVALAEAAWSLSPEVMVWSQGVWLVDLGGTWGYWRQRAMGLNKGLAWVWRRLLEHHFQSDADHQLSADPGYRGAIAPHPWSALLLLHAQREQKVAGLCTIEGKRGQRLWNRCSWPAWEEAHLSIVPHFEQELARFDPAGFRRAVKRFAQAAQKLGFERPRAAHRLPAKGVQNRYGLLLSQLWALSFGPDPSQDDPLVWVPAVPSPPPSLRHVLEDSPVLWEQVEPCLKPDFDSLAKMAGTKQVLQLQWSLFLAEGDPINLSLDFRHPHHLGSETGHQKTALARAQLAFEAARSQGVHRLDRDEEYCDVPPVLGWELTLTQCIEEQDLMLDLFGGLAEQGSGLDTLKRLENQLPIPLFRYQLQWDWQPENSYTERGTATDLEAPSFEDDLLDAARNRPLLIRPKPEPLDFVPRNLQFCESTGGHWWEADSNREYHRCTHKGRTLWVYQDAQGQWYEQGLFC